MRKRKRATPVAATKREPVSLYDINCIAPSELEVGEFNTDTEMRRWWGAMRVYVKAMHDLDRAVLVHYVTDEKKFYLSSVPSEAPRDA